MTSFRHWSIRAALGLAILASSTLAGPAIAAPTPAPSPLGAATPAALAAPADAAPPAALASPADVASPAPVPLKPDLYSAHLQLTNTQQYHGNVPAAYSGPQSFDASAESAKTFSMTAFLGRRLWSGAEGYVNVEVDQGFGLSNTYGLGGFTSGEAYKVGAGKYYERAHRYFIRQIIGLGGEKQRVDSDQNQIAGFVDANRLTLTLGKFSAGDIFDTNAYAHDPRNDFLNWSLLDAGAYDYAADAWGFTYGLVSELTEGASTWRLGAFQMSREPNSTVIDSTVFGQYQLTTEFERRTSFLGGHPGSFKLLAYGTNAYIAPLADVTANALQTGTLPNPALFRTDRHWKLGADLNLQQEIAPHIGVFSRVSASNGSYETFDFTEIDRSLSAGLSVDGGLYGRSKDTFGVAAVQNALSLPHQQYFAAGGVGVLLGDGKLSYGQERILESYYKIGLTTGFSLKLDFQRIGNPGYNTVRGPVSVYGLQFHYQI